MNYEGWRLRLRVADNTDYSTEPLVLDLNTNPIPRVGDIVSAMLTPLGGGEPTYRFCTARIVQFNYADKIVEVLL